MQAVLNAAVRFSPYDAPDSAFVSRPFDVISDTAAQIVLIVYENDS